MNNKAKLEKYRGLSVTALVTGLLSVVIIPQIFRWSSSFHVINLETLLIKIIIVFILGIGFPLTAIVCGSVDLKRIKAGRYSNKGKGFSITGIVLGSVFLIPGLLLFYEEIIFNTSAINDFIFKFPKIPSR
ncbi:MAG: DUF4190 domain-containing protein [Nitrososphaeraceae archaeon]